MHKYLREFVRKRLESYAARLLETHNPKVIAVTGSVGKTSTKLAIAHLLETRFRVLVHKGNFNTEFGLPLSLFDLDAPKKVTDVKEWLKIFSAMRKAIGEEYPYDVVVLEMGADKPGDIHNFMRYIHPEIGVVTAVAKVHLEEFRNVESILEEKWSLALGSDSVYYNHDDPRLVNIAGATLPDAKGYGLNPAFAWAELIEFNGQDKWTSKLHIGKKSLGVDFPVVARQAVYSLVVAAAVANDLGIGLKQIQDGINNWPQPAGRMQVLSGKNGSTILDDSYNASPYATVAAIDTLMQFSGRKLAILGTMNELGDYETAGHRLVGKHTKDLDLLVTIGRPANDYLLSAAIENGLSPKKTKEFMTPFDAGEYVSSQLQPGDVVLVKGSQNGVFAEEAAKVLLADEKDSKKLVRQSSKWMDKKKEQFNRITTNA